MALCITQRFSFEEAKQTSQSSMVEVKQVTYVEILSRQYNFF